jgi:hypothetical protein
MGNWTASPREAGGADDPSIAVDPRGEGAVGMPGEVGQDRAAALQLVRATAVLARGRPAAADHAAPDPEPSAVPVEAQESPRIQACTV